jgi:hypothetical protein
MKIAITLVKLGLGSHTDATSHIGQSELLTHPDK